MSTIVTWVLGHRRWSAAGAVILVLGLAAVADWPHQASAVDLRGDFAAYATQVNDDVTSCSLEVEQTLSAYNQITAGVSTQRETAAGIASQTALDCTPFGNSAIQDLGTLQPPRSLARYGLDQGTAHLYTWCFTDGVDVAQDIEKLLSTPGNGALLVHLRARLTDMEAQAAAAQQLFDKTAATVGITPVPFGLDAVRPSVLVG